MIKARASYSDVEKLLPATANILKRYARIKVEPEGRMKLLTGEQTPKLRSAIPGTILE